MTGLVEITEHQIAQSKYTARKRFLFILEVRGFLGIFCLQALVEYIEGRNNMGTLAPIRRAQGETC